MRKKNELRRSCNLCRTRKIACSGERICTTCRERRVECVYDLEGFKGRPPASLQADAAKSQANVYPETWYSPVGGSPPHSSGKDGESGKPKQPLTVAAELEIIYREHFAEKPPLRRNNRFLKRVVEFNRSLVTNKGHATDSSSNSSSTTSTESAVVGMNYHGLLTLLTLDLVETLVLKFSRLGVHAFFGTGERYYRACMLQDETTSMFDTRVAGPDTTTAPSASAATSQGSSPDMGPLENYSSHLLAQMVDLWFTHHPLSILLSRSLLLTDLRTNRAKPTLLAIILVDAHEFTKDPEGGKQAAQLLEWAIGQLNHLETESPDLTTAQACFLIAWYLSCIGQARRAVCYTTYAGRIATQLKYKIHEIPITDKTHINGIDRGAVEVEMTQNLWWLTFVLTLWSFIQMDLSFADLLPSRVMQVFPPSAAECSILQLDRTMGNITTQHAQTASLQSVWLLSHVSSFVAHIYALYPHPKRGTPSIEMPASNWQDQLLSRLDRLMDRQSNLAAICVDAREATQDMIDHINKDAGEDPVGPWLLVQYYTVSIHLLFPRDEASVAGSASAGESDSYSHHPTSVLTNTVFTGLEKAMQGLIGIFLHVKAAAISEGPRDIAPPVFLHSYVLGLDAIGRAFTQILIAQDRASILDQQISYGWLQRLLPSLTTLQKFFDHDVLLRDHRWRPVKRQLKNVRQQLNEMMTPTYEFGSSSTMPQSSTVSNFSTYCSMPAPVQSEKSLTWPDWQSTDHPGSGPLDLTAFNMDTYFSSTDDPLMTNNHTHGNGDGIHSNASMEWPQNSTQLTSMWSEAQATNPNMSSQIPNTLPSLDPLKENGKRQADMMAFDDGTLIGDFSADQLNSALFESHPSGKRFKGSQ